MVLTGPESLPVAVIAQAWRDAGLDFAVGDSHGQIARRVPVSQEGRLQARLFLTAEAGEWAAARQDWCVAAGVDPDLIRTTALRALAARRQGVAA